MSIYNNYQEENRFVKISNSCEYDFNISKQEKSTDSLLPVINGVD